jgi:hypothetical protein
MKARTGEYLTRAERQYVLAQAAISPGVRTLVTRVPFEWVLVMAWHAALDYVQALIYERHWTEHANHHAARRAAFDREPEAHAVSFRGQELIVHYDRLEAQAHAALYTLGFTAHPADVDEAVHEDVYLIREAVAAALVWTPPASP